MTIHQQSDYGYNIPQIEHRNRTECLRRAALCDELAFKYPNKAAEYQQWARDWRIEAQTASTD
jgi:hypothetical protein